MKTDNYLLLFRPDGTAPEAFESALRGALPAGSELALALPASALPALAHVAARDVEIPDAIVTVAGAPDAATLAPLAALVDRDRSRAVAVVRHAVLPGRDNVRLFFGLRRLAHHTRASFQDYWLNHHADYGRRLIPPYTYHQLHADTDATAALAAASGLPEGTYDGIVEVHFPDVDALVAQLSRPDVAEGALADEKNFIDHATSQFWAFQDFAEA